MTGALAAGHRVGGSSSRATLEERRRRLTAVPGLNTSLGWLTMSPAQRTEHLFRFQELTAIGLEALVQLCGRGREEDRNLVVVRSLEEIIRTLVDAAFAIEDFAKRSDSFFFYFQFPNCVDG